MKFLADECVYCVTVKALRNWGHDVLTVQEVGLIGHENGDILTYAVGTGRILITNDIHFSNIIVYPPTQHLGIIVLKIRPRILDRVHAVLFRFLDTIDQEGMKGTLVIIDRNKYRVRKR